MFKFGRKPGGIRRPAYEGIITPQPIGFTADWQNALIQMRNQHRQLTPALVAEIRAKGLMTRCSLLVSDHPSGPLVWRYISAPTVRAIGATWAKSSLNQPHDAEAALGDYSRAVQATYNEAAQAGELTFNHVTAIGIAAAPVHYTQLIMPFEDAGRTALLIGLETLS